MRDPGTAKGGSDRSRGRADNVHGPRPADILSGQPTRRDNLTHVQPEHAGERGKSSGQVEHPDSAHRAAGR